MDGETYYRRQGWSGCAGSAWDTLAQATRDGWEAAAREFTRHAALTRAMGYGDDTQEPMAPNEVILRAWETTSAEAAEWRESEAWRLTCLDDGHPDDEDCWEHDPALRLERAERTLASLLTEDEHAVGIAFTPAKHPIPTIHHHPGPDLWDDDYDDED